MKTTELAFRVMADHMRRQNKKSVGSDGLCAYRGKHGLKCAVGALIKDEHYSKSMEGYPVVTGSIVNALKKSGWPADTESINIYFRAQEVHDLCAVSAWRKKLLDLAKGLGFVGQDIK